MPSNTTPDRFLRAVAAYVSRFSADELRNTVVVFPNKRASMFFRTYYGDVCRVFGRDHRPVRPRTQTIGAFISRFRGDCSFECDSIELLFILYKAYLSLFSDGVLAGEPMDFDRFAFWGAMIVSDFSDVDAALADPAQIFSNLRNLNEIQANYLTDDQRRVIRSIWGDEAAASRASENDRMWRHIFDHELPEKDPISRFVRFWEILHPLYLRFTALLREARMAYPGLAQRIAVEALAQGDYGDEPLANVLFVGFSDLTVALSKMMSILQDRPGVRTLFFWDVLPRSEANAPAFALVDRLARRFPAPDDFELPPFSVPEVTIASVPSNVLQTKAVSAWLRDWDAKGFVRSQVFDKTCVVLPDRSLLQPMLRAIPESIENVNITMGLSFRDTPFASLLRSIITLHIKARFVHRRFSFFHEDVSSVVGNPELKAIAPDFCDEVRAYLLTAGYNIPADFLCAAADGHPLAVIFSEVDPGNPEDTRSYIFNLIDALVQTIMAVGNVNPGSYRIRLLEAYRRAAARIFGCVDRYGFASYAVGEIKGRSGAVIGHGKLFSLLERILANETINVSGNPVKGLQVMGVLETRALDFTNVVFLSMNERVFPRRRYMRTLIPQMLRRGYGLPTADNEDLQYSYYFYRLLSRSTRVVCFFDSRSAGLSNGAESRFLHQLRFLQSHARVRRVTVSVQSATCRQRSISIAKTPQVMADLARFSQSGPGALNLSASALKAYRQCPLKFYFAYVRRLGEDNTPTPYMDAATQGSVVHEVLQDLFEEARRYNGTGRISDHEIDLMVDGFGKPVLTRVLEAINRLYHHSCYENADQLPYESQLLAELLADTIRRTLEKEKADLIRFRNRAFTFVAAEEEFNSVKAANPASRWEVDDGLAVNFSMKIDRHDAVEYADGSGAEQRFVDYKTGSDSCKVTSIDDLFGADDDKCNDAALQLLVYAEAYADMSAHVFGKPFVGRIRPALYRLRAAFLNDSARKNEFFERDALVMNSSELVWSNIPGERPAWADDFRTQLNDMIRSIFDPEKSFAQTDDRKACRYCPYKGICGRYEREREKD